jgi:hypothetical protein
VSGRGDCAADPRGWILVDVTAYQQEQAQRVTDPENRDTQPGAICTTSRSRTTAPVGTTASPPPRPQTE